jgi:thymidylate synthase
MQLAYKPYSDRTPDTQYRDILKLIMAEGVRTHNKFQNKDRITHLRTPNMEFRLDNGFPIITERDISSFFRKPIAEVICFMHGARHLDEFKRIGGKYWPNWWARWVTAEKCAKFGLELGDLGPGSYGPGFVRKQPEGHLFNQFQEVVKQMKDMPWVTTHRITPWIPELTLQHNTLQRKVVVAPCHGDLQITITGDSFTVRMDQRSGDVPIGVPSNMLQWAAFCLMLGQVTGYRPEWYVHSIHDAHMYSDQLEKVKELVEREPIPYPTLVINDTSVKDLLDFRPEHFDLVDYQPHPAMNDIPVTE